MKRDIVRRTDEERSTEVDPRLRRVTENVYYGRLVRVLVAKLARSGTPPYGALSVRNLRYALIMPPPVVDDTWRLLQGTGFASPS